MKREPCIKCGKPISIDYPISLRTVMLLGKLHPNTYADEISRLEGISKELAQEFVDHKMGHRCVQTEPPCPDCGTPLKTWHATGCRACSWRRDMGKPLPEYYPRP